MRIKIPSKQRILKRKKKRGGGGGGGERVPPGCQKVFGCAAAGKGGGGGGGKGRYPGGVSPSSGGNRREKGEKKEAYQPGLSRVFSGARGRGNPLPSRRRGGREKGRRLTFFRGFSYCNSARKEGRKSGLAGFAGNLSLIHPLFTFQVRIQGGRRGKKKKGSKSISIFQSLLFSCWGGKGEEEKRRKGKEKGTDLGPNCSASARFTLFFGDVPLVRKKKEKKKKRGKGGGDGNA